VLDKGVACEPADLIFICPMMSAEHLAPFGFSKTVNHGRIDIDCKGRQRDDPAPPFLASSAGRF